MDILKDYTPQLLSLYHTLDPYLRTVTNLLFTIKTYTMPILLPLLDRAAVFAQDSPAIITLGLLLLLLIISMQILNFARRLIVFWTRILFYIAFYGTLVVLAMVVWQRGVGRTAGDLVEWAQEVREVWWREYRRWDGYQKQGPGTGRPNTGGYAAKGGSAGTGWR